MKGDLEYRFKKHNSLCEYCNDVEECDPPCLELTQLLCKIKQFDNGIKYEVIESYKKDLIADYSEPSKEYEVLGNAIINKFEHLHWINDIEVKIGYVVSYESKKKNKKLVFGKCEKVSQEQKAYLPFDYIITMYDPNVRMLDENQRKIVMLHELQHIELGDRGLKIRDHDIEDFSNIISKFGYDWNDWFSGDVDMPDILGGEINEI